MNKLKILFPGQAEGKKKVAAVEGMEFARNRY